MIIVLDTNVLVSGLLKPYGPSAAALRLVLTGDVRMAHDYRVLREYRDVLSRPAFGFSPTTVAALLETMQEDGIPVTPPPAPETLPDPDDAPFWEAALAAGADAIVTGNKRHFPRRAKGPRILSPSEFLSVFGSGL